MICGQIAIKLKTKFTTSPQPDLKDCPSLCKKLKFRCYRQNQNTKRVSRRVKSNSYFLFCKVLEKTISNRFSYKRFNFNVKHAKIVQKKDPKLESF
jgi:hypothetical protein